MISLTAKIANNSKYNTPNVVYRGTDTLTDTYLVQIQGIALTPLGARIIWEIAGIGWHYERVLFDQRVHLGVHRETRPSVNQTLGARNVLQNVVNELT